MKLIGALGIQLFKVNQMVGRPDKMLHSWLHGSGDGSDAKYTGVASALETNSWLLPLSRSSIRL